MHCLRVDVRVFFEARAVFYVLVGREQRLVLHIVLLLQHSYVVVARHHSVLFVLGVFVELLQLCEGERAESIVDPFLGRRHHTSHHFVHFLLSRVTPLMLFTGGHFNVRELLFNNDFFVLVDDGDFRHHADA